RRAPNHPLPDEARRLRRKGQQRTQRCEQNAALALPRELVVGGGKRYHNLPPITTFCRDRVRLVGRQLISSTALVTRSGRSSLPNLEMVRSGTIGGLIHPSVPLGIE